MSQGDALRVLHLDSEQRFRGGQRQLLWLVAGQREDAGLQVRVLARSDRLRCSLGQDQLCAAAWAGPASFRGLRQLAEQIDLFRPHIVHAHDARSHGAARLLLRDAQSHRCLVVHRRIDDPPSSRRLTRWKYARAHFICVSHAVRGALERWGVEGERMTVVHSGVPVPSEPSSREAAIPASLDRPLRLLGVGALVKHKGHSVLLNAMARMRRPAHLDLWGTGELAGRLLRQVDALRLSERVRFLGDPHGGIRGVHPDFHAADLFVHPSLSEGLGSAVLDALAAGLPVLASEAGGLPEAVGQGGWLVQAGNPDALADQLDALAEQQEGFAQKGRLGREHVLRGFTVQKMVAGVRAVYDRQILAERRHQANVHEASWKRSSTATAASSAATPLASTAAPAVDAPSTTRSTSASC